MSPLRQIRRRVDRAFYRALFRLYRLVLPSDVAPGPLRPETLQRVLIAPRDAVGDLVMTTPLLSYLRTVAPQARIDVLASARNATLLEGDPRVDRVLVHAMDGARWIAAAAALRRERYDAVVNAAHSQHGKQGWFTALVAGRRGARIAIHRPRQYRGFFTHLGRVPGFERRHHVERTLYALQRAVPAGAPPREPDTARFPMSLTPDPTAVRQIDEFLAGALGGRPFAAVNCWASRPPRTLAPAQATDAVTALLTQHPELAVVLTPPPALAADAAAIAREVRARLPALPAERIVVAPPSSRLADLVALLHRAAVVLTPDTANVHLAAALGRPVAGLYNSTWPDPFLLHRPFGVPYRVAALPWRRPLRLLATMPPTAIGAVFDALWAELCAGTAGDQLAASDGSRAAVAARATVVPAHELGE